MSDSNTRGLPADRVEEWIDNHVDVTVRYCAYHTHRNGNDDRAEQNNIRHANTHTALNILPKRIRNPSEKFRSDYRAPQSGTSGLRVFDDPSHATR
ncbi:hypothetical protein IFR04_015933 [Cadophora malorum]|uniref:Uncharacterized protein n=1 Tax=Cadophora malorum TaxID=108018 RepID=A0A8H7VZ03_9HELO|nr:hypothetical protein IFR04_015933 [Cadophora malorum]